MVQPRRAPELGYAVGAGRRVEAPLVLPRPPAAANAAAHSSHHGQGAAGERLHDEDADAARFAPRSVASRRARAPSSSSFTVNAATTAGRGAASTTRGHVALLRGAARDAAGQRPSRLPDGPAAAVHALHGRRPPRAPRPRPPRPCRSRGRATVRGAGAPAPERAHDGADEQEVQRARRRARRRRACPRLRGRPRSATSRAARRTATTAPAAPCGPRRTSGSARWRRSRAANQAGNGSSAAGGCSGIQRERREVGVAVVVVLAARRASGTLTTRYVKGVMTASQPTLSR